jgi:hypothetical protein
MAVNVTLDGGGRLDEGKITFTSWEPEGKNLLLFSKNILYFQIISRIPQTI